MNNSRVKKMVAELLRSVPVNEIEVLRVLAARDMIKLADNRLVQAAYSYGNLSSFWKSQDYLDSRFEISVDNFFMSRNHEDLLDIINWCRILWVCDSDSRAHFRSTSSENMR